MDEEQKRLAEELLFSGKKKLGFAKLFFFGVFDASKVFPFPKPSDEELKRTEELLQKLEKIVETIDPQAIDRAAEIPSDVLHALGDQGILGMTIPKDYGGLGFSQYAYCRAVEKIAGKCAATALFVNAHQSVGLKALLLFGTEAQKKRWLPPLASGKEYAAFSLTEPNAGSDAAGIETKAVFDPLKNVYRITGIKQWTTNGSIAKMLTVMAKTLINDKEKITAFIVTPDMPGFKVTAKSLEKVGMRGSWTSNLEFQDMEVPAANILGPPGGGLKVCLTVLDYGRTTFGATCTGAAKFAVEHAIRHAKTRYQFKRPLASFGLVKKKIALMSALLYAMESTTYLTAGFVDADVEDFMLESAMLKVFASDALWRILYETMQIYGGRSFFTDHPFERMMRDARLNMIGEGSNEVMRAFIGLVGMRDVGMHLKNVVESIKHPVEKRSLLFQSMKAFAARMTTPKVPVTSPDLREEALALGSAVRRFGFAVVKLLARYGEEIVEKQLSLDRIATAAICIYTTSAVLSRVDAESNKKDLAVAKLYCRYAMDKLDRALSTLYKNNDEMLESVSDLLTGGQA